MSKYTLEDYINLPETIKKLRKSKKMSQKRLGKKVGVTDKTICAYENGLIKPPVEVLFNIFFSCGYCLDVKENIFKTPKKINLP